MSVSHERKCHPALLAFKKQITHKSDLDEFVTVFSLESRRLQLYKRNIITYYVQAVHEVGYYDRQYSLVTSLVMLSHNLLSSLGHFLVG